MKKFVYLVFLFAFTSLAHAQDMKYARQIVDTLTSKYFLGRGYVNDGMKKAADYLAAELKTIGLQPLDGKKYFQPFSYSVNTFPNTIELQINGVKLTPGKDFLISADSKALNASFDVEQKDSVTFVNPKNRCIVKLEKKLTWEVSQEVFDYTQIVLLDGVVKEPIKTVKVNVKNKLISNFKTANVCAVVQGTSKSDSIVFFTAHYDHLGAMGAETFFPGANDNASGVSVLLNLAKYFQTHPQKHSIGFIFFAGEEAGLVGSKYYTENPIKPLSKIKFLFNIDLLGTGEEGCTIVNSTVFPNAFKVLTNINAKKKYLVAINERGKAANSDHYFFTEKGVPSFFMYTLGGIKAYHDVYDISKTLPLTEFVDATNLLKEFAEVMAN
jgi:aminopeptidase YwaD